MPVMPMIAAPARWNSCDSARVENRGPFTTTIVAAGRDGQPGNATSGQRAGSADRTVRIGVRDVKHPVVGVHVGVRATGCAVQDLIRDDQRPGRQVGPQ